MRDSILRFFTGSSQSKEEAKRRLKLLLIHDQLNLSPEQLEDMKRDIMSVVREYLVIHEEEADFRLDQYNEHIALVSSLPVAKVRNRSQSGA